MEAKFILETTWAGCGDQSIYGEKVVDGFNASITKEVVSRQNYSVKPLQLGVAVEEWKVVPTVKGITYGYVVLSEDWSFGQQEDKGYTSYYIDGHKVPKKTYYNTKKRLGY